MVSGELILTPFTERLGVKALIDREQALNLQGILQRRPSYLMLSAGSKHDI
jgi:hypothetical protein